jgi:hypothetical protein
LIGEKVIFCMRAVQERQSLLHFVARTRAIVPVGAIDPQRHNSVAIINLTAHFLIFCFPLFVQHIINLSAGQPGRYPRHPQGTFGISIRDHCLGAVRGFVLRRRFCI